MSGTAKTQCFAAENDVMVKNGGRWAAKHPGDMLNEATTLGFFGLAAKVGQQAYPGAALKENYVATELDTEAEIIAALNATNATLNKLRTALINLGLVAAA